GSSYLAYHRLWQRCRSARVPVLSYEVEYPVLRNWAGVLTGRYFDHACYLRRTLPRADGIVGISSYWAETAARFGVPFTIVPSYLPDDRSALSAPSPGHPRSNSFHLVGIGKWVPRECLDVVFRALRMAHARGIPVHYTAIGDVGHTAMEQAAMR